MNKIVRTPAPGWLKEKWEEWAKKYSEGKKFNWPQREKRYPELVERLSKMTKKHCSFCDAYPMIWKIPHTIEHFRPKTKFPLLAYQWDNLFLCCGICQKKGDEFDDRLLKPDDDSYHFDKYFIINWDTGKLTPNPEKSVSDQKRAEKTIKFYRLNKYGRPDARLEELESYKKTKEPDIDKFSYRFFIERGASQDEKEFKLQIIISNLF